MKILTPAYGRDYTTHAEAIKAYEDGSDWVLNDIKSRWDGKYCSCRDFVGETIKLRFNGLRDSIFDTYNGSK